MSRDAEMDERWLAWPGADAVAWGRSEIRRELESLRAWAGVSEVTSPDSRICASRIRTEIDRRLAALDAPGDTHAEDCWSRVYSALEEHECDCGYDESVASGDSRTVYPSDALRERVRRACSTPAPPGATEERAWLIELQAEGAPTVWLGRCGWTSPDFAIRFAREQDARDGYALFTRAPSPAVRFTEHIWLGPEAAPTLATLPATGTPCASPPARPTEDAEVLERAAELMKDEDGAFMPAALEQARDGAR